MGRIGDFYLLIMAACLIGLVFTGQWQILSIVLGVLLVNLYWTCSKMDDELVLHIRALHDRVRSLEKARADDLREPRARRN